MEETNKEELERDKKLKEHQDEVQKEFKGFFQSLKEYLPKLLTIKVDTDKEATAERIREGISIKGHTAWILVFSILIASIGLNVSSTAVVIGAMLISPLMGPILGIGFSIAVNDVDTLKGSLINFGAMVALSIITSFVFFSIPIFKEATPELLARTKPDVRDVLIAVSGGLALIIAISRPRPQFNTVAGVAIATALMPPLCTAGFGLATGNFGYFGGALFLFTINCIYIALAAFVITKYLRFPMRKYINHAKRRRISNVASIVALVILGFSIYQFYLLYKVNHFTTRAERFIEGLKEEGVNLIGESAESIDYKANEIKLYVFGRDYSARDEERWKEQLREMGLGSAKLVLLQSQDNSGIREDIDKIKELYINSHKMLSAKDETIVEKDMRIDELEKDLRRYYSNDIRFDRILGEIRINYEDLESISFAREYRSNFEKMDTVNIVSVKWKNKVKNKSQKDQEERLKKWLEQRLSIKNLEVRKMP